MLKDLEKGLGLDTNSDPYSNGESIKTVYDNIESDSFGVEKKRDGFQEHIDSSKLSGIQVSDIFYWLEDNLLNKKAWIVYDKSTGTIKKMEG